LRFKLGHFAFYVGLKFHGLHSIVPKVKYYERAEVSVGDKSFLQRVRGALHMLHPTERRLAGFLLNFPGEIASYSARELAGLANVSAPTVSRFIKRLGYANYEEARHHVRAEQKSGAALLMVAATATPGDAYLHAHLNQTCENMERTLRAISRTEVDAIAHTILEARRCWVLGFRTSQSFATYFHWQGYQVVPGMQVIPQAGQTLAEHIAAIQPEDCVVIFALARRVRAVDAVLAALAERGAKVILVSDDGMPHRADVAWHLCCATIAPGPLFSHASVMLLIQVLATRLIELSGPTGRARLAAIEALHDKLQEL
jgi:DNA-binding MurR/RpiR family transcriptional regulator